MVQDYERREEGGEGGGGGRGEWGGGGVRVRGRGGEVKVLWVDLSMHFTHTQNIYVSMALKDTRVLAALIHLS